MTGSPAGGSTPIVPASSPWAEASVARLTEQPVALPGTPYAYAIVHELTGRTFRYRVERLDLLTGEASFGSWLPVGLYQVVSLGPDVGLLDESVVDSHVEPPFRFSLLAGLRPAASPRLQTGLDRTFTDDASSEPGQVALPHHGAWFPTGERLELVDTATGQVLARVAASGTVWAVSVDPSGRLLYDFRLPNWPQPARRPTPPQRGFDPLAHRLTAVLEQRSASTGRLLASVVLSHHSFLGWLVATTTGVWAQWMSDRNLGGPMETAVFRSHPGRLEELAPPPTTDVALPAPAAVTQLTEDPAVFGLGRSIWLVSQRGMSCADPATGRLLAGKRLASAAAAWVPFAQYRGIVYGWIYASDRVIALRPPTACLVGARASR
jgi:hypothetical protein